MRVVKIDTECVLLRRYRSYDWNFGRLPKRSKKNPFICMFILDTTKIR